MTANKTARSTIAYLIVRDQAHENAFAKALESLGVNWGSVLPIPKTNAERFPESRSFLIWDCRACSTRSAPTTRVRRRSCTAGVAVGDGSELTTAVMPEGFPMTIAPERREEFAPGLDKNLLALIQATAEIEISEVEKDAWAGGIPDSGCYLSVRFSSESPSTTPSRRRRDQVAEPFIAVPVSLPQNSAGLTHQLRLREIVELNALAWPRFKRFRSIGGQTSRPAGADTQQ